MLKTLRSNIFNATKRIDRLTGQAIVRLARKNYYAAKAHYCYKLAQADRRAGEPPILVYQMGKVGSTSITETLQMANIGRRIYHFHILRPERVRVYEEFYKKSSPINPNYKHRKLKYVWLCQYIRKQIERGLNGKKWKIVTLVRDPIARNIADFFENSTVRPSGRARQYKVQSDWYNFEIMVNDNALEELIQIFLEKYKHDCPLQYFDLEFKSVLGIDLYASDFPTSRGYKIYKGNEFDILLIRLEDLNKCATEAFKEFLSIDNLTLLNRNVGTKKEYADMYRVFKNHIVFPEGYIDRMYSSKLARHFYSEAEIERFRKKWSRCVSESRHGRSFEKVSLTDTTLARERH